MTDASPTQAINSEQFEALLHNQGVFIVDFWASWCAPCKQFAFIYDNIALQYPEITFAKINIEEESELAEALHIRSIPHLMIFKDGIAIYSESGTLPESALTELIQQALEVDVTGIREELMQVDDQDES